MIRAIYEIVQIWNPFDALRQASPEVLMTLAEDLAQCCEKLADNFATLTVQLVTRSRDVPNDLTTRERRLRTWAEGIRRTMEKAVLKKEFVQRLRADRAFYEESLSAYEKAIKSYQL